MSVKVLTWAFDQPIGGNEKVVLLALADRARDDGLCWPGQAEIARRACVSERTVRRVLERLEEQGYLRRQARGGAGEGRQTDLTWLAVGGQPAISSGGATGQTEGGQPDTHAYAGREPSEEPSTLLSDDRRESAPASGKRMVRYRGKQVPGQLLRDAECVLRTFNETTGRRLGLRKADGGPSPALTQVLGAMLARPEVSPEEWKTAIKHTVENPPGWIEGGIQIGHVFGERAADCALSNDGVRSRRNGNGRRPADPEGVAQLREMRLEMEAMLG